MPVSNKNRYIIAFDLENTVGQDIWCENLVQKSDIFAAFDESDKNQTNSLKKKQIDQSTEDYRYSELTITPIDITDSETMNKEPNVPLKATYLGYGVVRLYKEYEDHKVKDEETIEVESDDTTVAIVAIPTYFSPTDFIGFLGESVIKDISHIRLINSDNPNRFMGLIKFRTNEKARKFQDEFNGVHFNSMESESCHVIFVKSVLFKPLNLPRNQPDGVPYLIEDPFTLQVKKKSNNNSKEESKIIKELPTCPVCLERMDSDVTGLLTISCQHTFHSNCLSKWRDDSCPVCRYSNLALGSLKQNENLFCSSCGSSQNLWICLICGNVGCGRYDSKHAIEHYESTNHCFAMDLSTQRVWDYAGDNYVHRLLQNESDGKLVEVPGSDSCSSSSSSSKNKSLENTLEYTDVLLSQLESQREYYESRLAEAADVSNQMLNQRLKENEKIQILQDAISKMQFECEEMKKKAQKASKVEKIEKLARTFENKWKEEQSLSEGLLRNLEELKQKNEEMNNEKLDLEEQVKDLMFYLESQEKFKDASEEVKNGTIVVQQNPRRTRNKNKK